MNAFLFKKKKKEKKIKEKKMKGIVSLIVFYSSSCESELALKDSPKERNTLRIVQTMPSQVEET